MSDDVENNVSCFLFNVLVVFRKNVKIVDDEGIIVILNVNDFYIVLLFIEYDKNLFEIFDIVWIIDMEFVVGDKVNERIKVFWDKKFFWYKDI